MTPAEIRNLNDENRTRGWIAIPPECPPAFQARIAELRAKNLETGRSVWSYDQPVEYRAASRETTRPAVMPATTGVEHLRRQLDVVGLFFRA